VLSVVVVREREREQGGMSAEGGCGRGRERMQGGVSAEYGCGRENAQVGLSAECCGREGAQGGVGA